jgi:hypothetical protein
MGENTGATGVNMHIRRAVMNVDDGKALPID